MFPAAHWLMRGHTTGKLIGTRGAMDGEYVIRQLLLILRPGIQSLPLEQYHRHGVLEINTVSLSHSLSSRQA